MITIDSETQSLAVESTPVIRKKTKSKSKPEHLTKQHFMTDLEVSGLALATVLVVMIPTNDMHETHCFDTRKCRTLWRRA